MKENPAPSCDVCVVGGAGRVGLPLALVLADSGFKTLILDINETALKTIAQGAMPYREEGGQTLLKKVNGTGRLTFSSEANSITRAAVVVLTVGTPIDEFHNPNLSLLIRCLEGLIPHLRDEQTIILRSTIAPGTTNYIDGYLRSRGKKIGLAFCPERVVQGKAIEEIRALPQLVSGTSPEALAVAKTLFSKIAPEVVEMSPLEAEFAKLVCNAFRYMQFAATNQLYMAVESAGLDYCELLSKMKRGYPRMGSIPGPGFAAGPCLMKDTMQLFAFQKHNFVLGQMAMTINEGLPNFIVEQLARRFDLRTKRVGILGMAFKADSDDIRDSLSYKLGKLLRFHGADVSYSDEYAKDPTFVDKETLVRECDVIILGVPHAAYRSLHVPREKEIVDLWSALPSRQASPTA
ncbi:MAG: nucleotide sugar dehydrogenase [Verrucomicrobia bacterium]|nr:MAG: nucleotide sugar dehydrogenase [Verrucomicrobiota bacterium]